jgi:hypothetical protein
VLFVASCLCLEFVGIRRELKARQAREKDHNSAMYRHAVPAINHHPHYYDPAIHPAYDYSGPSYFGYFSSPYETQHLQGSLSPTPTYFRPRRFEPSDDHHHEIEEASPPPPSSFERSTRWRQESFEDLNIHHPAFANEM